MRQTLRNYYLQQMGVDVWVSRPPKDLKHFSPLSGNKEQGSGQAFVGNLSQNGQQAINHTQAALGILQCEVESCIKCPLHQTRTQTVFARGNSNARLMVIGEAPGFHEDKQGKPFVGKAGNLLDKMLVSVGIGEEDVYVANVLKCRPPDNRDPQSSEIQACADYLVQQIRLVDPDLILGVGRFAGQFLLAQPLPLNKMRNKIHEFEGKPVIISYHPAYLLRSPADKKKAYSDLLFTRQQLQIASCS